MARKKSSLVTGYARMWPREIFDGKPDERLASKIKFLKDGGVYVLYQDAEPYYIGKTDSLVKRLSSHARPQARYFLWNQFSAFVVGEGGRDELEAILIAAMPTANSSKPKLTKIRHPREVVAFMNKMRYEKIKPALPRKTKDK